MQGEIVNQGLLLMAYGMGTVMVFLTALVLVTTAMSRGIERFFPEPAPEEPPRPSRDGEEERLGAVIAAAVHRYRTRHGPVNRRASGRAGLHGR